DAERAQRPSFLDLAPSQNGHLSHDADPRTAVWRRRVRRAVLIGVLLAAGGGMGAALTLAFLKEKSSAESVQIQPVARSEMDNGPLAIAQVSPVAEEESSIGPPAASDAVTGESQKPNAVVDAAAKTSTSPSSPT